MVRNQFASNNSETIQILLEVRKFLAESIGRLFGINPIEILRSFSHSLDDSLAILNDFQRVEEIVFIRTRKDTFVVW